MCLLAARTRFSGEIIIPVFSREQLCLWQAACEYTCFMRDFLSRGSSAHRGGTGASLSQRGEGNKGGSGIGMMIA